MQGDFHNDSYSNWLVKANKTIYKPITLQLVARLTELPSRIRHSISRQSFKSRSMIIEDHATLGYLGPAGSDTLSNVDLCDGSLTSVYRGQEEVSMQMWTC